MKNNNNQKPTFISFVSKRRYMQSVNNTEVILQEYTKYNKLHTCNVIIIIIIFIIIIIVITIIIVFIIIQ